MRNKIEKKGLAKLYTYNGNVMTGYDWLRFFGNKVDVGTAQVRAKTMSNIYEICNKPVVHSLDKITETGMEVSESTYRARIARGIPPHLAKRKDKLYKLPREETIYEAFKREMEYYYPESKEAFARYFELLKYELLDRFPECEHVIKKYERQVK